jgi:hypothetical protein
MVRSFGLSMGGRAPALSLMLISALVSVGCGKRSQSGDKPAPSGGTVVSLPGQAAASDALDAGPKTYFSTAVYSARNELLACGDKDVTRSVEAAIAKGGSREQVLNEEAMKLPQGPRPDGLSTVVLTDTCARSFADKQLLASCTGSPSVYYYSFDLLDGEPTEVRDCYMGGRHWWTLEQDSEAYKAARQRYETEKAKRDAGPAQAKSKP